MSLVNAVRVVTDRRRFWFEDSASIAEYDRFEASLSIGEDPGDDMLAAIGAAYLEAHAQPKESIVADVVGAEALNVGDTATVACETLRALGLTKDLQANGLFRVVPEWSSLRFEKAQERERVVERMIARAGGGFASAATVFGGVSKITGGRLSEITGFRWSWQTLDEILEDDPTRFPVWTVDEPCRMYEFVINAKWYDDVEAEQISIGDTSFGVLVNGVALDPIFLAVLDEEADEATYPLFGYATLNVGDRVQPFLAGNGLHESGSITIRCSERV